MSDICDKPFSIKTRKPIDDEALLTEEDKQGKVGDKGDDCTTRRRACKNCVCGRAELEQKMEAEGLGEADFQPPAGGCGNCSKGDAFRCAGCPFLGKPAFNNTETGAVKLDLTDDF